MEPKSQMGGLAYGQRLRTPALDTGIPSEKRSEIKAYFNQTFSLYEDLFTLLATDEAYYTRADPLRHPLIFYYGHTACFFINKLVANKMWATRLDPNVEAICAVGVDELSWDDLNDKNYDWPTVAALTDYRNKVRSIVNQVIDNLWVQLPIREEDPAWIIIMGIEHERVHLETSSVLIRQLPLHMLRAQPNWPVCEETGDAPANQLLMVTGGRVQLGREATKYYGWDNEFGNLEERVSEFSAAQYKTTNKEFLEFVINGGYAQREWWSEEGWHWLTYDQAAMPRFWRKSGDNYSLRCIAQEVEMPWDWPVEVNYYEAKAFCNWLADKRKQPIRLPTEAEWLYLRTTECPEVNYPEWEQAPGNVDLAYWGSSCPVTRFQHGRFNDLLGNVWEWCESATDALPGFKPHPAYEDFSTPTFDGQHSIIKGGSWISTGNEALTKSRYAFRRHFYQHAGFRYISSDVAPSENKTDYYETDSLLAQYLEFHFGQPYFDTPNYPTAIVQHALAALGAENKRNRALDLGCAVGRAAFEMARHFNEVVGADYSVRFIGSAINLQQHGRVRWQVVDEGDLSSSHDVSLRDLGLTQEMVDKVKFVQGDACNLKENMTDFDLVIAANLVDRLYDPMEFLVSIQERVVPGGILAISSPYTWLEEHTQKSRWLGGYRDKQGENVRTIDRLREVLSPNFELVDEPRDVSFVIRETSRKFQYTLAQLSLWRKKHNSKSEAEEETFSGEKAE